MEWPCIVFSIKFDTFHSLQRANYKEQLNSCTCLYRKSVYTPKCWYSQGSCKIIFKILKKFLFSSDFNETVSKWILWIKNVLDQLFFCKLCEKSFISCLVIYSGSQLILYLHQLQHEACSEGTVLPLYSYN